MSLSLPRYSSKDYVVMPLVVLPFAFGINAAGLGTRYFSSVQFFILATLLTAVFFGLYFIICGAVAVIMKNRFPQEHQVSRRLAIMIFSFLIMSGLFLFLLFSIYSRIPYFHFELDEDRFIWAYFCLGIINIFITFLQEGIARFDSWKQKQKETDELKESYRRSRLQGLKSQVNPHFLFNCLNSLSSLINEEGDDAERFLDEMSKVYRYMLRGDDDSLVTLATELKFLDAYSYLLQTRYGNGLQITSAVQEAAESRCLPALTLQIVVENAFTLNSIQKNNPLHISISATKDELEIRHNLQPKLVKEDFDAEAGLDNLVGKYQLLGNRMLTIADDNGFRTIRVPLLPPKKEEAA